jgi:hypothetical protein
MSIDYDLTGLAAPIVSRGQITTVQANVFPAADEPDFLGPTYFTRHPLTSIGKRAIRWLPNPPI